ncbi:MAG: M23 family metallopeptidase [Chitinophagaceae bacterium]|nr:M23 family metallopeptidase [Chitinophagaceae bacterium]
MKLSVFIFFLLYSGQCFSQKSDTIKMANNIPIKDGYVVFTKTNSNSLFLNPSEGIIIYSDNSQFDSVFSISNGTVLHVKEVDDEIMCTIKSSNYYYTYSMLKKCVLSPGDSIHRSDIIGEMDKGNSLKNFVQVIISKRGKVLSPVEHIKLLRK